MAQMKVTIDDRVREELVQVTLDAALVVADVLKKLVKDWGLPERTLDRQAIWYDLLRVKDESRLDAARTLAEQGVEQGDTLQLVSREGRDTWLSVRDILEEIRDQLIEEAIDQLTESALDALDRRLQQAAGTGAEPRQVAKLEARLKAARIEAVPGKATTKTSKATSEKTAAKASAKTAKMASAAGTGSGAAKTAAQTAQAGAKSGGGGGTIGCIVLLVLVVGGAALLGELDLDSVISSFQAEPPPPPTQEPVFFATDEPFEPVLGTGDVQVTLRWYSEADLDLYVVDPSGAEISFAQPTSSSGGALDVDSNRDCSFATTSPVENVFWPPGGAPSGRYTVSVDYYAPCGGGTGPQTYEVTVLLNGQVWEVYSYTIEEYGSHEVVTFSY